MKYKKMLRQKFTNQMKGWMAVTAVASSMFTCAVPAAEENTQSDQSIQEILAEELLTVHFIDVGQGLAILAQAGDDILVYDGGNSDASSYFVSYLKEEGVDEIDYMIASHYDSDHLSGLVGALHAFDTDVVIAPDYEHGSKLYKSFYAALESQEKEVTYPEIGDEYKFGEGSFTILGPTQIRDDSNNNSVVIRLDYGETSFLFTADAESKEEKDILEVNENLDCDVLSVGHHGSASSTTWDFLEQVLPEYAVISCGINNSYGHPDEDTLEKLEAIEAQIFRTDMQGNIIASSDGKNITWNVQPDNGEVLYASDYISVREEPNELSDVVGELGPGNQIRVLNRDDNDWATIIFDGITSYIPSKYLSEIDPLQSDSAMLQPTPSTTQPIQQTVQQTQQISTMVWLSATGSKYHSRNNCGNMNPDKATSITETDAIAQGYGKCKKCW